MWGGYEMQTHYADNLEKEGKHRPQRNRRMSEKTENVDICMTYHRISLVETSVAKSVQNHNR